MVSPQFAGNVRRSAAEVDGDRALQRGVFQIAVARLRNVQPIAGEHQRRFQTGDVSGRADQHFVAELDRTIADKRDFRPGFIQRGLGELDGLRVGSESRPLELTDDIVGGGFKARRADIAAREFVVRQKANVRPPGFPGGIPICVRGRNGGQQQERSYSHDPVYGRANTTRASLLLGFGSVIPLPPVAITATYCLPFLPR